MKYRIADLFCGAGGTSSGAVEAAAALGRLPEVTAVNHWQVAIDTHTANHPTARHLCTGIDSVNPLDHFERGGLDLLWASPECTHHSIARGGKPINDQSRSTAWHVLNWVEKLLPPIVLVENVPEFATWGPVGHNGRPLKRRKGEIFQQWIATLRSFGYKVDYRLLCAADYGDPTTRTRLFVQAVRGRRRIVWPDATHSREGDLLATRRWAPARDIIDWSLPAGSIFERKKPLSPKTLARIEAGLRKFGLKGFIVPQFGERPGQEPRTHDIDRPAPAVTSHGAGALVQPFIVPQCSNPTPKSVDEPLGTLLAEGSGPKLVMPYIVAWDQTSGGPGAGITPIDDPLSTVVTKARHGVAEPFLVKLRGTNDAADIDKPAPTVTAGGTHLGLAQPFLVNMKGQSDAADIDQPAPTVTAHAPHLYMAEPFLVKTANGGGEDSRVKSLEEPMPTVCGNRGDVALIEPHLLPQQSDGRLRPVSEPAPTVATAGAIALVQPFLVSFYGNGQAHDIAEPAPTVTCKDRFGLVRPVVEIDGNRYLLDIRFRMLQPHELALAQGFPAGYIFTGNKTDQVKQIGNAVPRRLARALVGAALSQCEDVTALVAAEERKGAA
ncbi:DNA cytosine methyltransferase [Luteolibacter arcticus]|uniref:DNA (cytosine-5-)-methyltransferase n=1 Tax=Luteolibacter arcticus TaxID=1581411 RepID=A0ABT3GCF2_9BACT|nr:DNA cytosine methyltransferase [Luteolibacter arcticus]MCW1921299.1 DNA cytosine methyltransferase [Luteolibacter arcticus]